MISRGHPITTETALRREYFDVLFPLCTILSLIGK